MRPPQKLLKSYDGDGARSEACLLPLGDAAGFCRLMLFILMAATGVYECEPFRSSI